MILIWKKKEKKIELFEWAICCFNTIYPAMIFFFLLTGKVALFISKNKNLKLIS